MQRMISNNGFRITPALRKKLLAVSQKFDGSSVTDASGIFRLAGFSSAPYSIRVETNRDIFELPTKISDWVASPVFVTTPQQRRTKTMTRIVLTRGAIIQGRVLDRATGQPLPDVNVASLGTHRPTNGSPVANFRTDKMGRYALRVTPGTSSLYVSGLETITATVHFEDSSPYPNKEINVIRNGGTLYSPSSWIETQLDNTRPRLQRVGASTGAVEIATVKGQTRTLDFRLDKLVTKKLSDGLHVYIPAKQFVKPPQNNNASDASTPNTTSSTRSVDLSSPQSTLRTFMSALNRRDIERIPLYVQGGLPIVEPQLQERFSSDRLRYLSVRNVRVSQSGDNAFVVMQVKEQLPASYGNRSNRISTSRLQMKRSNGVWKIVPRAPAIQSE